MAKKVEVELTGRVIRYTDAAVLLARSEFVAGVLVRRSNRGSAVANRVIRRLSSDYFPGLFGPFLKDFDGKCAGCGEWNAAMLRVVAEAYTDEKALLIVANPVKFEISEAWTDYLNNWARERVDKRGLKSSVIR